MKNIVRVLALLFLFHFFSIGYAAAQSGKTWSAPVATVEKLEKDKAGFIYSENKVPSYTLPALLRSDKGIDISSDAKWNSVRRPEILELFRKNIFGRVPETQYKETFKIVKNDKNAIGGTATEKKVDILIESAGRSLSFSMTLFTPKNAGIKVPVFLLIDPWMADTLSAHWMQKDDYWPVVSALKRGYGMAVFSTIPLDPDNFDNFKNGIHGLLDKNPRPADAWGTLAAWAWGASRCLDYLITDKDVAADKVAVVGHSRAGKTALWAGAQDTRFAMVISNESGAGGAALARRRFGETVERLNTVFPHWYCSNFSKFNNNEDKLPVDMHMLLALTAPRALYIDCADEDLWGDPHGSYLSLYNALPVYKLLDRNSDLPVDMPALNQQVISGKVGFHIREGVHNLLLRDWNCFMDFADRVFK